MEKQENIIATYQQIIQETEQQLQKARKRIRYISLLRLILFVTVASAIIFWSDGWLKLIVFTVIPIIAFIWLVQSHNRWFYWKDYLKKKIEINQQELRALQYDFSDFDNGKKSSIRLISILSTWTYLASTHYSSISIVLRPPSANSVLPTGSMHIWKKKKLSNNVRKRFGNYLQNLSFDNNSACSDYFIKASHPTPLKLKNGSTVRATIGNTLSSVSSRQQ